MDLMIGAATQMARMTSTATLTPWARMPSAIASTPITTVVRRASRTSCLPSTSASCLPFHLQPLPTIKPLPTIHLQLLHAIHLRPAIHLQLQPLPGIHLQPAIDLGLHLLPAIHFLLAIHLRLLPVI